MEQSSDDASFVITDREYIVHVMNCMRLSYTNDVDVGSKKGITGTLHLESEM